MSAKRKKSPKNTPKRSNARAGMGPRPDALMGAQTAANKAAFLEAFRRIGSVTGAAQQAGIGRVTHYGWLHDDPAYAKEYEDATEEAADRLEQEARRRAVAGVDEPVFYQGVQCGVVRKYSDNLLIFLLKGARPEKYRERMDHNVRGIGADSPEGVLLRLAGQPLPSSSTTGERSCVSGGAWG